MSQKRQRVETLQTAEASEEEALEVVRASGMLSEEQKALLSTQEIFSSPQGPYLLVWMMGQCNVSLDMLRKARDVCIDKSFSDCKYADMAPLFGLKPRGKGFDIPSFPPSKCRIPLSVWQAILDGMDQLENEIGSFDAHENVQAKSQWTAAWFRPLVAMFESRILNRPEKTIVGNRTRGGRVELQYCLQGQCLLVVIVVKTLGDSMAALDAMAQLIAELDAADFCNRKAALAIPVVKGILTDGRYFRFVNFEDGKITRSPHIATQFSDHETTATSIKPICEMFFACLLEGWVHGLRAFHARSQRRETMEGVRRPSATDWDSACVAATNALKVASNLKPADKAQQAVETIGYIQQSVQVVLRFRQDGPYHQSAADQLD